ncbi:DUF2459 domain-containing protein [Flavobacteriaceae bacterium Ap0902]|nr:DUF2459 domain-containing protein [Flavobacteriaceae bacterium Ap0902]
MIKKILLKTLFTILVLPLAYLIIGLIIFYITVNSDFKQDLKSDYTVYLHTNGVHLDITFDKNRIPEDSILGLFTTAENQYISFGWREENFYLNTPEWKDLTFKNAFKAILMRSPSLMHVTRYNTVQPDWTPIHLNQKQYNKLLREITQTFQKDAENHVILLEDASYSSIDEFYRAKGSYHLFNTCNTWVNRAFKNSGLRACLWTPFDFPLIDKYGQQTLN